jgi:hypothetical protein
LAKNKNNYCLNKTLLEILNTLLKKNPSFIIDYMDMLILSNLIMHVYDKDHNKKEILEILNSYNENKKYFKIDRSNNSIEEMKRLNLIILKIKDQAIKDILKDVCLE